MVDNKKIEQNNDDDVNGNTLFELYKAKANDFQKVFVALVAFALIFLFLILFPYFSILETNNNINGQIGRLQRNITQHENNIYYYHIAENRIKIFQKDLKNSPEVVENETFGLLLITIPQQSNYLFNHIYHLILANYTGHKTNIAKILQNQVLIPLFKHLNEINNNNSSLPNFSGFLHTLANQRNILCDKFVSNYDMRIDCNLNNKILNLTNSYVQDMKQQNPINELTLTYPYCSRLYTVDIFKWDEDPFIDRC